MDPWMDDIVDMMLYLAGAEVVGGASSTLHVLVHGVGTIHADTCRKILQFLVNMHQYIAYSCQQRDNVH